MIDWDYEWQKWLAIIAQWAVIILLVSGTLLVVGLCAMVWRGLLR